MMKLILKVAARGSRASVFAVIASIREYFIWIHHQYLTKIRGTAG